MQRKLRAREKRQIGTQVKFDSTKTINHQQTHVCSFQATRERVKRERNQHTDFSPVFVTCIPSHTKKFSHTPHLHSSLHMLQWVRPKKPEH